MDMNLQDGRPMCGVCIGLFYSMALQNFTCKECGQDFVARHGGDWHYCDVCAAKISKCTMCGKKMTNESSPLTTVGT